MAFWRKPKRSSPKVFFSPEYDSGWEKEHGRLQRWRVQRVSVTPEEAGLCGCWQFLAVWRERQHLYKGKVIKETEEYSFYTVSFVREERSAQQLAADIRGHWNASETGSHYRRDKSLGEDASQISGRSAAQVMAALRNTVLALFELEKDRSQTKARYLPNWQRQMSRSGAIRLLKEAI